MSSAFQLKKHLMPRITAGLMASRRSMRAGNLVGSGNLKKPPTVGRGAWMAAPMMVLLRSVPSCLMAKES